MSKPRIRFFDDRKLAETVSLTPKEIEALDKLEDDILADAAKQANQIDTLMEQELIPKDYPEMELGESFWPGEGLYNEYHWPTESD